MRPASRGSTANGRQIPGSSGGLVPGTAMGTQMQRPNSGRLATARLRTGATPSGPGTLAAQGLSLNMSVNVQDRPVTGQGVVGMKVQGNNTGRIVEDTSYYVGILRKKITDITQETKRLQNLLDNNIKESASLSNIEKKHETLLKNKEILEGQLADYNLALDKARTSTDPDDVKDHANHLADKNRQTGQELDRIFALRKERESETQRIEEQIENLYRDMQRRINDLEPNKLRAYKDLINRQKEFENKINFTDNRLNEINLKIEQYENDTKTNPHRKEYLALDKIFQSLRREAESYEIELDISNLDPKEAHGRFVARVNEFKQNTKFQEDKSVQLKEEINQLKKKLQEIDNRPIEDDTNDEMAKHEALQQQDQEITAFMSQYDDTRRDIIDQQEKSKEIIVHILEHISQYIEDNNFNDNNNNNSSGQGGGGSNDVKGFKERNLATTQQTLEGLKLEKKKKERELEMLKASEPKLMNELNNMKENIANMKAEMIGFQDMESLHRSFDKMKQGLLQAKSSYLARRDAMKQQVAKAAVENETLKKTLASHDTAKDLDETEKRLRHFERTVFELNEFVESKTRETDFELVKAKCIVMLDNLNALVLRKYSSPTRTGSAQQSQGPGAQAKW